MNEFKEFITSISDLIEVFKSIGTVRFTVSMIAFLIWNYEKVQKVVVDFYNIIRSIVYFFKKEKNIAKEDKETTEKSITYNFDGNKGVVFIITNLEDVEKVKELGSNKPDKKNNKN